MNVAGAEAQNQIARIDHVADIAMEPIQPRLITHAAMSVRDDFVGNRLPADSGNRRFARRINVSHDHAIGIIESAPKFAAAALLSANSGAAETSSGRVCARSISRSPSVARISVG